MDAEKTGKLIRELRTEKALTQQELASTLHVSQTAVSKWESGKSLPDVSLLEPLSEVLGVSITDLVMGERAAGGDASGGAPDGIRNGNAEAAIESIIETSLSQRKKSIAKTIRLVLLILLGVFILRFYVWPREEKTVECADAELVARHYVPSIRNGYMLTEYLIAQIDGDKLQQAVSEAANGALWKKSITWEAVEFRMRGSEYYLIMDPDDQYSEIFAEKGIAWVTDVPEQIRRSRIGTINVRSSVRVYIAGKIEEPCEAELFASARMKCTYRDLFFRKHTVWLVPAEMTDTIHVEP